MLWRSFWGEGHLLFEMLNDVVDSVIDSFGHLFIQTANLLLRA